MTAQEIIEKIRAEIERLKGQLIRGACAAQIEMETNCKDEAYDEVLSFIDTLKEQPVTSSVEDAMKKLDEKIAKVKKDGSWKNPELLDEMRAEQPVREGLEEAAEKFARLYDQGTCDGIAQDCFIAGAKWQKLKDEERK